MQRAPLEHAVRLLDRFRGAGRRLVHEQCVPAGRPGVGVEAERPALELPEPREERAQPLRAGVRRDVGHVHPPPGAPAPARRVGAGRCELDGDGEAGDGDARGLSKRAARGGAGGEGHEAVPFAAARRPRGAVVRDGVAVREGTEAGEGLRERGAVGVRRKAVDEEPAVGGRRGGGGAGSAVAASARMATRRGFEWGSTRRRTASGVDGGEGSDSESDPGVRAGSRRLRSRVEMEGWGCGWRWWFSPGSLAALSFLRLFPACHYKRS